MRALLTRWVFYPHSINEAARRQFLTEVWHDHPEDERVLDVGSGDGVNEQYVIPRHYIALDYPSDPQDRPLGTKHPDLWGDAQKLPFKDRSFDTVLLTEVLEHVPGSHAVLAEIHRVLIPGGTMVLTVPQSYRIHEAPFDYWRFTKYGLEYLFKANGFKVISISPSCDSYVTSWVALVDELARANTRLRKLKLLALSTILFVFWRFARRQAIVTNPLNWFVIAKGD